MQSIKLIDFLLISPLLVLFLVSLVPLIVSVFKKETRKRPINFVFYVLIGLISASGLLFSFFGIQQRFLFEKALVFDGLSVLSSLVLLFITLFSLFIASENFSTATDKFAEFVFLMLNSALGMIIITWSNDLVITFIAMEMTALCFYILMALSREEKLSKEAAFKYFVLSGFASAFFLYGVSFIYGSLESTYLSEMAFKMGDLLSQNRLFLFGVGLVMMGLFFKVAIFPFHSWAPDVYQGAPTPLTGFMATALKLAIFVTFLRWVRTGFLVQDPSQALSEFMEWGAVLTLLAGNIAALLQKNFKRMLAYSSIAHSGFILIGLLAAGIGGEGNLGVYGLIYYVFSYSLMTLGLFGVISLFEKQAGTEVHLSDLKALNSRHPWLALCITIFLISLAGLPPTAGFFAKLLVFYSAVKQNLFWLTLWAVISTLIGVYYYLRPVLFMYQTKGSEEKDPEKVQLEEQRNFSISFKNKKADLQVQNKNLGETRAEVVSVRSWTYFFVFFSAFLTLALGFFLEPFYQIMVKALKDWF